MNDNRLLITATPRLDESFFGYVARLCELNGYDRPAWVLSLAGLSTLLPSGRTALPRAYVKRLATLSHITGANIEELGALLCPAVDLSKTSDLLLFGHCVPRHLVQTGKLKICADCICEEAYLRKVWDYAPVTTCPLHRRLLQDECPSCRLRLSVTRRKLLVCDCGFDWRDTAPGPLIPEEELTISRHIYQLCGLTSSMEGEGLGANGPLANLSLSDLISALFFVAGQFEGMLDMEGRRLGKRLRIAELHRLLCRALCVFDHWPENFYDFLDQRRNQIGESSHRSGVTRDFPQYRAALYSKRRRQLSFIRLAFEDYLHTRWKGGTVARFRRIGARKKPRFLSRRQASAALMVSGEVIDALLQKGRLRGSVQKTRSGNLVLVDAQSVESLTHEVDKALCRTDAQRLLGLSHRAVSELAAGGLLRPQLGPAEGKADRRINPEDVYNLLRSFEAAARTGAAVPRGRCCTFLHAARRLRRVGLDTARFIRYVLDGRLIPCTRRTSGDGLRGFDFDAESIDALASEWLRERVGDVLTIREAAALLETNMRTLVSLSKQGLFPATNVLRAPVAGLRITKENFEHFRSTYISVGALARTLGTQAAHLYTLLAIEGVRPILAPQVDTKTKGFYYLSEVNGLNLPGVLTCRREKKAARLLTLEQAAATLKCTHQDVLRLVQDGILRVHERSASVTEPYFSTYVVKKLVAQHRDLIGFVSTRVAAHILKTSISNVDKLFVRTGLLPSIKAAGLRGRRFYPRKVVETLANTPADSTQREVKDLTVKRLNSGSIPVGIEE